jgi:hypothetical protein
MRDANESLFHATTLDPTYPDIITLWGDRNIFLKYIYISLSDTHNLDKTRLENMGIFHGPLKMYLFTAEFDRKRKHAFCSYPLWDKMSHNFKVLKFQSKNIQVNKL